MLLQLVGKRYPFKDVGTKLLLGRREPTWEQKALSGSDSLPYARYNQSGEKSYEASERTEPGKVRFCFRSSVRRFAQGEIVVGGLAVNTAGENVSINSHQRKTTNTVAFFSGMGERKEYHLIPSTGCQLRE